MKNRIKECVEYISTQEGKSFQFNEVEFEKEFSNYQSDKSSVVIKILTVLGGVLSALAFLGALLIAGVYEAEAGMIFIGLLFLGAAIWMNVVGKKLLLDTISVTAYVIGLCLMAYGFSTTQLSDNAICTVFIIISLFTIGVTKNYILSVFSILTINFCLIFLIMENQFYSLIHVYNAILLVLVTFVFLKEAKLLAYKGFPIKLYNPIRIGLLFSLIMGFLFVIHSYQFQFEIKYVWASSIITIPLAIYVITIIAKIIGIRSTKSLYIVSAISFLFLIPTALSPAISGALLIILLSFLVNFKPGLVIGVLSFIYFISQYYYDLHFTLLIKSIILFITGAVFLLIYVFTHKKLSQNEKN